MKNREIESPRFCISTFYSFLYIFLCIFYIFVHYFISIHSFIHSVTLFIYFLLLYLFLYPTSFILVHLYSFYYICFIHSLYKLSHYTSIHQSSSPFNISFLIHSFTLLKRKQFNSSFVLYVLITKQSGRPNFLRYIFNHSSSNLRIQSSSIRSKKTNAVQILRSFFSTFNFFLSSAGRQFEFQRSVKKIFVGN